MALQTFALQGGDAGVSYTAWTEPLTAALARVAAAGLLPGIAGPRFHFAVVSRNNRYKTFTYASPEASP